MQNRRERINSRKNELSTNVSEFHLVFSEKEEGEIKGEINIC